MWRVKHLSGLYNETGQPVDCSGLVIERNGQVLENQW